MQCYKVHYKQKGIPVWSKVLAESVESAIDTVNSFYAKNGNGSSLIEKVETLNAYSDEGSVTSGKEFEDDGFLWCWVSQCTPELHTKDMKMYSIWKAENVEGTENDRWYIVDSFFDVIDLGPYDSLESAQDALSRNYVLDEPMKVLSESLENTQTPQDTGMSALINALIVDEYEAIDGYNSAIATAKDQGFSDVVAVLQDIMDEENIHVGQLQHCMELFAPSAKNVIKGNIEAEEQLNDTAGGEI